jgi:hypothetical protein
MVENSCEGCWGLESRAWFAGQGLFRAGFRVWGLVSVFQSGANRLLARFCSGKTRRARGMGRVPRVLRIVHSSRLACVASWNTGA